MTRRCGSIHAIVIFNDGSDSKLRRTLSFYKEKNIRYLVLALGSQSDFSAGEDFLLCNGSHRRFFSVFKFLFFLILQRLRYSVSSVQFINEQAFFVSWPAFIGIPKILDIYDSFFLKVGLIPKNWPRLTDFFYSSFDQVIVTDNARLSLLGPKTKSKAIVVPNSFLQSFICSLHRSETSTWTTLDYDTETIKVALFGSLSEKRGVAVARSLLRLDPRIQIVSGGWLYDHYAKEFINDPRVSYMGVVAQEEVYRVLAECHFLLAIYPDNNDNNLYASPNKIADSVISFCPLIINRYPLISHWIEDYNIGISIDSCETIAKSEWDHALARYEMLSYSFKQRDLTGWAIDGPLNKVARIIRTYNIS